MVKRDLVVKWNLVVEWWLEAAAARQRRPFRLQTGLAAGGRRNKRVEATSVHVRPDGSAECRLASICVMSMRRKPVGHMQGAFRGRNVRGV